MAVTLSSPITGGAQTGFTAPTYTHLPDLAPEINQKQVYVSALGGTQTGVLVHTASCPFYITVQKPKVFRYLGKPNPVTGVIKEVPMNVYIVRTVKGVLPLAGQPYAQAKAECKISVPAGSDVADAANLRALMSALIGSLSQVSAGLGDSIVSGTI